MTDSIDKTELANAYNAFLDEANKHEDLFQKTKSSPELKQVQDAVYTICLSLDSLHGLPDEESNNQIACFAKAIWIMGVLVGQRMTAMPAFVVKEKKGWLKRSKKRYE